MEEKEVAVAKEVESPKILRRGATESDASEVEATVPVGPPRGRRSGSGAGAGAATIMRFWKSLCRRWRWSRGSALRLIPNR